jgi:hypothetical protein
MCIESSFYRVMEYNRFKAYLTRFGFDRHLEMLTQLKESKYGKSSKEKSGKNSR